MISYQKARFPYVLKFLHIFQHQILLIGDKYKLILISLKRHLEEISIKEVGSNTNKNTKLPLTIDNPPQKQSLWIPQKRNLNEIETLISIVENALSQNTSRKRIPSNSSESKKKALKDWRKNVLLNKYSENVMHLRDNVNRFIFVDEQTDHEQIANSSLLKTDYNPTSLHVDKVKD